MKLDHIGIVGHRIEELATMFEAGGFTVTPLARHAGGRTGNRCVMLRDGGYLELISTIDGGTSATLDRFLARHVGAHILALGIDAETDIRNRLQLAFGSVPEPSRTDRAVDDADPDGPRARFTLLTPPDRPEGRVHLIHHETPEALWQPRFLNHANRAVSLEEVAIVSAEPAATAAWYSRLAGRPLTPDPAGGYALALQRGWIRIVPPGAYPAPSLPSIAALTLLTDGAPEVRMNLGGVAIAFKNASSRAS
ncbi:MAG: VOC family protein [Rhodospirillales bacterium]